MSGLFVRAASAWPCSGFLPRCSVLTLLLQGCLETWLKGRDLRGHSGCCEYTSPFQQAAAQQSSAPRPVTPLHPVLSRHYLESEGLRPLLPAR